MALRALRLTSSNQTVLPPTGAAAASRAPAAVSRPDPAPLTRSCPGLDGSIAAGGSQVTPYDTVIAPEVTALAPEDTELAPEDTVAIPEDTVAIPDGTVVAAGEPLRGRLPRDLVLRALI